jgi:hypothetical protein
MVEYLGRTGQENVQFLDPIKAKVARAVTLDKSAVIENVLQWM